jgi:hypothetical protein
VAGDFTGDGRTDLAVAGFDPTTEQSVVEVLLGSGDGTFRTAAPVDLGGFSTTSLVAGDFTGDGRTDLAVAGFDPTTEQSMVEVLLGNGDGTFHTTTPVDLGILYGQFSLVAGDFTGDGRTDLAFTGLDNATGQSAVEVLLGNGDGTFRTAAPVDLGGFSTTSLVAGDFTGDGRTDLDVLGVVPLSGQGMVELLLGNGDGTFRTVAPVDLGGFSTNTIVAGDFTGDGRTDLAFSRNSDIQVELSTGNGQFVQPDNLSDSVYDTPLVANPGDGNDDVFVVDQSGNILWRKGETQAPGSFAPPITINLGSPSRDIAFVPTRSGPILASVDLRDDAVSLFAYRGGQFVKIGSLPTGAIPAQVIAAALTGNGNTDLLVRNAGDGTVSVYRGDGNGGFVRQADVPIGFGASDIALADLDGTGQLDLVITNQVTGTVSVLPSNGNGTFGDPRVYQAGAGPYALGADPKGNAELASDEATAGLAVGTFTPGAKADIAAIDPGSNSFAILAGLGGGALANPQVILTSTPATLVRSGDFTGNGLDDLAILGPDGVTIYLADGHGGFEPPTTYATGPNPTGLTVADVNGDRIPDLLVGNAYGDVLVLVGDGHGGFAPYHNLDGQVALAVASLGAQGQDTFAFSAKGLNQVAAQAVGAWGPQVVGDRAQGILDPGAVVLADLNGDGIPDLIVANGGGNDVLVYPGLGGGQYGPAQAFPVGTDPVGVTVARLNGDNNPPDLVVANHGSNDLSILIGQGQGSSWTLVPQERLKTGAGPTATVVQDINGVPNLFVSDSGANEVRQLKGVGNGFFDDLHYTTYTTGSNPGPLFVDNFTGNPGQLDLVTINAGSNDLSLVPDINGGNVVAQSIPSGGVQPVAAVEGSFGGTGGGNDLLVANNGDGHLALFLSGADGLTLAQTSEEPDLPNPSALAIDENGHIFGDNQGDELAIPVILVPGYTTGSREVVILQKEGGPPVLPKGPEYETGPTLQPLNPTNPSLPVISTLLPVIVAMPTEGGVPGVPSAASSNETTGQGQEGEGTATTSQVQSSTNQGQSSVAVAAGSGGSAAGTTSGQSQAQAGVVAAPSVTVAAALPNQAPLKGEIASTSGGGEPEKDEGPVVPARPQPNPTSVAQFVAGLDVSFAKARLRALQGALWGPVTQTESSESASRMLSALLARRSPIIVGQGSPALTLAIEPAHAALSAADPSDTASPPVDAAEARPKMPCPSDHPSIEETPEVGPTPLNVAVAAVGLATVAWAHTHWYRTGSPRRRYRFALPGREATRP